jgi:PAS domain S-box-containing protein
MSDEGKTKRQLIDELVELRAQVAGLQAAQTDWIQTERRQVNEALQLSETRFRMLVEQSPFATLIYATDGSLMLSNQAAADLWNLTAEDVALLHESYNILEDKQLEDAGVMPYIRKGFAGEATVLPLTNYKVAGSPTGGVTDAVSRWLRSYIYPVRDGKGNIREIVLIQEDITERKQTEDARKEREYYLQEAQTMAKLGHWKLDPETENVEGSDELFRICGLSRKEATLYALAQIVHPNDREFFLYHIRRGIEHGESWDIEHRLICKDGTLKHVHTQGEAITDKTGKTTQLMGTVQDITERKQAEEAMRYQAYLLDNVSDAIISSDLDYVIQSWNPAAEEIYGWSADEVVGRPVSDVLPPEYPQDRHENVVRQFFTNEQWKGEVIHKRKDGTPIHVLGSVTLLRDDEGTPIGVVNVNRDITERKRLQEEALEKERLYRRIFETCPDGIAIADPGRNILEVNPAYLDQLGYTWEELAEKHYEDTTPAKWHEQEVENIAHIIGTGQPLHFEKEHIKKDGTVFPVALSWWAMRDADGKLEKLGVFVKDITERKRAEEAMKRRATQLALLNEIGSRIAATPDLDSLPDKAVHLAQESFGYHHMALFTLDNEQNELVMRTRAGRFANPFPEDHRLSLGQGMVGWVGLHGETLLANDVDAEPRYVNFFPERMPTRSELSVPIQVGGQIQGVLDVQSPKLNAFDENDVLVIETLADQIAVAIENARLYKDLRDRMEELTHTQAQLIHSAKLAAIGELAAGVAHELNNPLTSVLGFAELVALDLAPEDPNLEDLETIAAEARRARDIVRNLLDFSRQRKPQKQPTDVNHILQQTLALVRSRLENSSVIIEEQYGPDIGLLSLDVGQMKQVFLNLLSNAAHAMPDGGTLQVRTARLEDEVTISIADTGEGIPQEIQERIFEPFFTTKPSGTGLGLSVSLGIVQGHGGRFTLESRGIPGQGTMFTVWLPMKVPDGETNRGR